MATVAAFPSVSANSFAQRARSRVPPTPWLCIALLAASAHASELSRLTASLPDVDPPPQSEAQWIARSARINGVPMTLKAFRSTLTPDAVLHHYDDWSDTLAGAKTQRSTNAPWRVFAIAAECCFITIKARAVANGSEGTITVSPPLDRKARRAESSFPRPATTELVNLQQYDDEGVEAEHLALRSARAPGVEAQAFRQLLKRDGWTLTRDQAGAVAARAHVIEAQKGAQHALLTLLPDRARAASTAIVIIWRKS